jgi:hypothetical protein
MRKALLCGIGERGRNDVMLTAKYLIEMGWNYDEIQFLTTDQDLREGLKNLLKSEPGDTVTFHYSGPGAQKPK